MHVVVPPPGSGGPGCDLCPAGTWSSGSTAPCVACGARQTSPPGSTSAAECQCVAGMGFVQNGDTICSTCPPNTYQPGPVAVTGASQVLQAAELNKCLDCPNNRRSLAGATSVNNCGRWYAHPASPQHRSCCLSVLHGINGLELRLVSYPAGNLAQMYLVSAQIAADCHHHMHALMLLPLLCCCGACGCAELQCVQRALTASNVTNAPKVRIVKGGSRHWLFLVGPTGTLRRVQSLLLSACVIQVGLSASHYHQLGH